MAGCWRCEWVGGGRWTAANVAAAQSLIWRGSSSGASTGWCWWRRRADLATAFTANCARSGWKLLWWRPKCLSGKRKTNRRDANKLLDQLYDFDVNGNKKALRPIRVPTLKEQKSRRLCRMRSQLIKVRNILEAQGRGLLFDFDFHDVPPRLVGTAQMAKATGQAASPTIRGSSGCLSITKDCSARSSNASPNWTGRLRRKATTMAAKWPKVWGQPPLPLLEREAIDWNRFANRKQIGSYIGCCPSEFSTGSKQKLGSIDRQGNRRMRTLLVEAVWRLKEMESHLAGL